MTKQDLYYKGYKSRYDPRKLKIPVLILIGVAIIAFVFCLVPFIFYNPSEFIEKAQKKIDSVQDTTTSLEDMQNGKSLEQLNNMMDSINGK